MTMKRLTTKSPILRVHANALTHRCRAIARSLSSLAVAALLFAHARSAAAEVTPTPAAAGTPVAVESPEPTRSKAEEPGEDLFVHPFFAHMSLADPVNTASFRFTGIEYKSDLTTGSDFGVHIEAGLLPRLGIHIRNDSIKREPFSEVMLMYNLFTTTGGGFGVSGFGQVSIPTGSEAGRTYKGLFGAAVMLALAPVMVFNGNVHYDPKNTMAEWEGAFVFRGSKFIYPVLEFRGELTRHLADDTAYVLVGLKFRIIPSQTLGAGVQIAMTSAREYNDEALIQYGIEF